MRRGTTPTHNFVLPIDQNVIHGVEITYCQNRKIILQKYDRDCEIADNIISVTLTQMDTFAFSDNVNVEIQLRILTENEEVLASNIICVSCERCLSDEVL